MSSLGTFQALAHDAEKYVMNTYARLPIALVRGEGTRAWDSDGRSYLDFISGIAVNALGHCHPRVVEAVTAQARRLMHCSNLFYIEPQVELARLIVEASGLDKVFFCNSGAEANEGAIKLARKYAKKKHAARAASAAQAVCGPQQAEPPFEIITARQSFHGRTLATLTATGQPKYQAGFEPLMPGFKYVPFNDIEALRAAISPATCAIMLEPIQGEGGVNVPAPDYLQNVRRLCDQEGFLLILDEVQTGVGRTGKMFAFQHAGIKPDIMTLAKGLGGGFPIGALVATDEVAATGFGPGDHASTFGGNPLACAAGVAVMQTLADEDVPARATAMGSYLRRRLYELNDRVYAMVGQKPFVDIRGLGLMVGAQVAPDFRATGPEIATACLKKGLLLNCVGGAVLRFLPPLTVSEAEIDEAVSILTDACLGAREGVS